MNHADHIAQTLQKMPCAVIECSNDLVIGAWNQGAERMFGYSSEQALGQRLVGLILSERDAAAWTGRGADATLVVECTRKDGDTIVCEWMLTPILNDQQNEVGTLCLGRDATARTQAMTRLEHHDLLLRVVLDSLPIAVCSYDLQGNFTFHDGRGILAAGLKRGQLLGQNALELFDDVPEAIAPLRRAIAGESSHVKVEALNVSWETWGEPIRDPATKEVTGVVTVTLDDSEGKRREAELQDKLNVIELQQRTIRQLSTPIIEVWDGVLTAPMIGMLDSTRAAVTMQNLLDAVVSKRTRFAILDLTGVEIVDTATASYLVNLIRAIRLLGAEGIITGIRPNVAQIVVSLGLDLSCIATYANLRTALMHCIRQLRASSGSSSPL